jgi:hypothetical protein
MPKFFCFYYSIVKITPFLKFLLVVYASLYLGCSFILPKLINLLFSRQGVSIVVNANILVQLQILYISLQGRRYDDRIAQPYELVQRFN